MLEAGPDQFDARNVIVAMATHQVPRIPEFAPALDTSTRQIHSARYRNPHELQDGPTIVVGAGNSGGEIALEIAAAGHDTFLAGDIDEHVPFRIESVPARYRTASAAVPDPRPPRLDRPHADRTPAPPTAPVRRITARPGQAR